jgi:hypothetical protein
LRGGTKTFRPSQPPPHTRVGWGVGKGETHFFFNRRAGGRVSSVCLRALNFTIVYSECLRPRRDAPILARDSSELNIFGRRGSLLILFFPSVLLRLI